MAMERLQKLIAKTGICSRRKAEEIIKSNRVKINGVKAIIGDSADPTLDQITIDDSPLVLKSAYKVILINKPIGFISTCNDEYGRRTIMDLLPREYRTGLHPVGRLDCDSRGAMIITNHGRLTMELTHPRFLHTKTYRAWVKGHPSSEKIDKWSSGLMLDKKLTIPAKVSIKESNPTKSLLKITLREGRNRQIRRIASLIGHPVIDLQRIAISNIRLDDLQEGNWRELTRDEWEPLLQRKEET